LDIDPELVSYVITIVLGLIATVFGKKWVSGKSVTIKFAIAINELAEAIEDDRITQEEAERIVRTWSDVIGEAKGLIRNGNSVTSGKTIALTPLSRIESLEKKNADLESKHIELINKIDQLIAKKL